MLKNETAAAIALEAQVAQRRADIAKLGAKRPALKRPAKPSLLKRLFGV